MTPVPKGNIVNKEHPGGITWRQIGVIVRRNGRIRLNKLFGYINADVIQLVMEYLLLDDLPGLILRQPLIRITISGGRTRLIVIRISG